MHLHTARDVRCLWVKAEDDSVSTLSLVVHLESASHRGVKGIEQQSRRQRALRKNRACQSCRNQRKQRPIHKGHNTIIGRAPETESKTETVKGRAQRIDAQQGLREL